MKLGEFISMQMEPMLQEGEDYARTLQPNEKLNTAALRDHAKVMLQAIAKDRVCPQSDQQQKNESHGENGSPGPLSATIDEKAKEHGMACFGSGFTIENPLSE